MPAYSKNNNRIGSLEKLKRRNTLLDSQIDFLDALNLTLLFFFFLSPELNTLLQSTARFILLPMAGIIANIASVWAFRIAFTDTDKNSSIPSQKMGWAAFRFVGALAMSFAVFASFSGLFATEVPAMMFMLNLAFNALVSHHGFIFSLGKENGTHHADEQQAYHEQAIEHGIGLIGFSITAVAVTTTMFLGLTAYAPLGIAGGLIRMAGSYFAYQNKLAAHEKADSSLHVDELVYSTGSSDDEQIHSPANHRLRKPANDSYELSLSNPPTLPPTPRHASPRLFKVGSTPVETISPAAKAHSTPPSCSV